MFSSSMASYDDLKRATAKAISKVLRKKLGSPHCEISLNWKRAYLCSQVGINLFLRCILLNQWHSFVFDDDESNKEKKKRRRKREYQRFLLFSEALLLSLYLELSCVEASFLLLVLFSNPSLFFFLFLFFS